MLLPMLLPSGVSVDSSTLEEHQKREATWGRAPNDPFTGVPFTPSSKPLPNPQLKCRIDQFLLQQGMMGRRGMLGRKPEGKNLPASRLVAAEAGELAQKPPSVSPPEWPKRSTHTENSKSGSPSGDVCDSSKALLLKSQTALPLERTLSQGLAEERTESEDYQPPQAKRPRNDAGEFKFSTILNLNSLLTDCQTITPHSRHPLLLSRAAIVRQLGRGAALRPAGPTLLHFESPSAPQASRRLAGRIDR